jgi:uncharacterized protein (TIGR02118 family)
MKRTTMLLLAAAATVVLAAPAFAEDLSAHCTSEGSAMTVKTVTLLARKPGTSLEDFKRHYETVHVPGARERIPALARADYRRNFIGDKRPGAPIDFDVVTEMTFASQADYAEMRKSLADPAIAAWVREDVAEFADPSKTRTYVVDECKSG